MSRNPIQNTAEALKALRAMVTMLPTQLRDRMTEAINVISLEHGEKHEKSVYLYQIQYCLSGQIQSVGQVNNAHWIVDLTKDQDRVGFKPDDIYNMNVGDTPCVFTFWNKSKTPRLMKCTVWRIPFALKEVEYVEA